MILFAMIPQLCESRWVMPRVVSSALAHRLIGTVWEPNRLRSFPGLLDATTVVSHMRTQFRECFVPEDVWSACTTRLAVCDLPLMQAFPAWQRLRGLEWTSLPPFVLERKTRARLYAGNSGQRWSSDQSKGLDHLLPPGLGPAEHVAQALDLPSPFTPHKWPDDDVQFVAYSVAVWQDELPLLANRQRKVLQSLCTAVRPLSQALDKLRCSSSVKVASAKNAAFVALLTCLLRWPDHGQASCFIHGFPIVGQVSFSGMFRPISGGHSDDESVEDWLHRDAAQAVNKLLDSPPPKHAQEILELTLKEKEQGFCSELMTKDQVDRLFGQGSWRPMERFLLVQGDSKKRLVDNCRKTEHNAHAQLQETIFTVSVDFIASATRDTLSAIRSRTHGDISELPWLRVRVGTDDLPDAYRGHPVQDSHLPLSVVAIHVPHKGWRFTVLYGLAYGLEAAVVAFNRLPLLGVSAARRCASSMAAAYFDDELSLEFIADEDVSRKGLYTVFSLLGSPPQLLKSFSPGQNRHYLGTSVHVGDASLSHVVRFQPKFLTLQKVLHILDTVLESGRLARDTAGKLRGDLQWFFSMVSGQAGKFASPVLRHFQHSECDILDTAARAVLSTLRRLICAAEPRCVDLCTVPARLMHVYTDASFENGQLRLGWVMFCSAFERPQAGTCAVPQAAIDEWQSRNQQIFMGETLAVLLLPVLFPEFLSQRDVLWFIDNAAACSAAIHAASVEQDVHEVSLAAAVIRASLACRCWFEWIDSNSNLSDGLSRLGLSDPWTLEQRWDLCEKQFPKGAYRSTLESAWLQ